MPSDPYSAAVLADSPVGYWKLSDAFGSATAIDASGNGNNGTVIGGVTFGVAGPLVSDPSATAAQFNGLTGGINLPINLPGYPAATLEGWANFSASADNENLVDAYHFWLGRIYELSLEWRTYTSEPGPGYFARVTVWTVSGSGQDSAQILWMPSVQLLGWHYLAVTYDGTNLMLYVDGASVQTAVASPTGALANTRDGTSIGYSEENDTEYTDFVLAQKAIYGTALSPARIVAHYNAALQPAAPGAPTLSLNGTSVGVGWTAGNGATSTSIQRSPDNATWTTVASGLTGASGTYTDASPPTGTDYYRVGGVNGYGTTWGASASVVVPSATGSLAPILGTAAICRLVAGSGEIVRAVAGVGGICRLVSSSGRVV